MSVILIPLLQIIKLVLEFYMYAVIIHVILSWLITFNIINATQEIVRIVTNFLFAITEPVFSQIRRVVPTMGGIDLSPLILFFIIFYVGSLVDQLILTMR